MYFFIESEKGFCYNEPEQKEVEKTVKIKIHWKEFLLMNAGISLVAFGVYFFKFPNNFSTGGVSGLSVLLAKLCPSISAASFVTIFNFLFLILGFIFLNRNFGIRTIYCTIVYSAITKVLEWLFPMSQPFTDQKILELFFAMLLPAIGSAILFNLDASSGGTDILAMIVKKYTAMDIGKALMCSDFLIALSALFVFDAETGLFSLLGLLLKSVLVDYVFESFNLKKSFTIVTEHPEEICKFINQNLHRGATVWQGTGSFTHKNHTLILTALSRSQAVQLRRYVKEHDPHAFILVSNTSEIFGNGFSNV